MVVSGGSGNRADAGAVTGSDAHSGAGASHASHASHASDASQDDFAAWFRLLQIPGLGRTSARRLLAACGSPAAVLRAGPRVWREVLGPAKAAALDLPPPDFDARLSAARAWLDGGAQRGVLTIDDAAYPALLLASPDPPLLLYVQGPTALLSAPALAVVGSRHPSAQGADNAKAFAAALGREGLVIVSGLAQGVDAAAHEGALQAGAGTVAVLGTGPDRFYPPRHAALAQRIIDAGGVLLSEYAPGTPPLPEHFPQRNRIIAGLSRGTLVVEAALRSGSLITARLASEAGREVFAIPGSIHAPQSRGCHALIRQGAKLVESAQDVLEELGSWRGIDNAAARPGAADEAEKLDRGDKLDKGDDGAETTGQPGDDALTRALLDALGHDPVTLDALLARTGADTGTLLARLLDLELQGRVARLPAGLFQRRGTA